METINIILRFGQALQLVLSIKTHIFIIVPTQNSMMKLQRLLFGTRRQESSSHSLAAQGPSVSVMPFKGNRQRSFNPLQKIQSMKPRMKLVIGINSDACQFTVEFFGNSVTNLTI